MSKVIQFLDALKKELPNMFDVKEGAPMAEFWESFDATYQEAAEQSVEADACCESPGKEKCDQCQDTGIAHPHNH